jgi:hypothetical protein
MGAVCREWCLVQSLCRVWVVRLQQMGICAGMVSGAVVVSVVDCLTAADGRGAPGVVSGAVVVSGVGGSTATDGRCRRSCWRRRRGGPVARGWSTAVGREGARDGVWCSRGVGGELFDCSRRRRWCLVQSLCRVWVVRLQQGARFRAGEITGLIVSRRRPWMLRSSPVSASRAGRDTPNRGSTRSEPRRLVCAAAQEDRDSLEYRCPW